MLQIINQQYKAHFINRIKQNRFVRAGITARFGVRLYPRVDFKTR